MKKTIYLTHTEDDRYILSDTKPSLVKDYDGEGQIRSNKTSYNPEQGYWVEADSSDICRVLGVEVEENDYINIDVW